MLEKIKKIRTALAGLVIFRDVAYTPALTAYSRYLEKLIGEDMCAAAEAYAAFVCAVFDDEGDISEYLYKRIIESDNIYVRKYLDCDSNACASLERQLEYELGFFSELCALAAEGSPICDAVYPEIKRSNIDFVAEYRKFLTCAHKRGVGLFSRSAFFTCDTNGDIIPLDEELPAHISDLVGYERERKRIIQNTEALIGDLPACDILLYGDAGTGKSTTVKAIAADYAAEGLRLIEVPKDRLCVIPNILRRIASEPLKFIIFIDDLSFESDDMGFCILKTVLEGGAGVSRKNSAIYVTSNHRHLMKETKGDRDGDEIHVRDNLQGMMGLSARFGLTVTFLAPDRELYLGIVKALLESHGIPFSESEAAAAEAFAIRKNGRTGRLARQYADLRAAGIDPIR